MRMPILIALSTACFSQSTPPLSTRIEIPNTRAQITAFLAQHPIRFVPGSVELRSSAIGTLDSLAAVLTTTSDVRLVIDGYAHSQHSAQLNRELSEHRAEAVRLHLALRGVPVGRMRAAGQGSTKPGGIDTSRFGNRLEPQLVLTLAGR